MGNNRMLEVWRRDGRSMLVEIPVLAPERFAGTVCPRFAEIEFVRQLLDVQPEWLDEIDPGSFTLLEEALREENPEFVAFANSRLLDMIDQPVLLLNQEWDLNWAQKENPDVIFATSISRAR